MKKLIAYYAHENENIQILVQNIQQYTHGNIYEIKTIDISSYDIVFIGYPIWWGTYPRAIASFLKDTKPYHQTIVPFSNERLAHSIVDLKKTCPHNEILPGLGIKSEYTEHSCTYIQDWLKRLELD